MRKNGNRLTFNANLKSEHVKEALELLDRLPIKITLTALVNRGLELATAELSEKFKV